MFTIEKAKVVFLDRGKQVEKFIEDESYIYYERIEKLEDQAIKTFCLQVVCNTIGDGYDFFKYIHSKSNIFYQRACQLNQEAGQKLYKWLSMYHVIHFKHESVEKMKEMAKSVSYVFGWNRSDKRLFRRFMFLFQKCDALFEVLFAKKMIYDVFQVDVESPATLAFIQNLFYNSNHQIKKELG